MKKPKPSRNAVALARENANEKASVVNVRFTVDHKWEMRPSREKSRRVPCDTQRVIVVTNSGVHPEWVRSSRAVVAQRFIGTIRDKAVACLG